MVNTYLLGCEKTKAAILVDPGHDVEVIEHSLSKSGFTVAEIVNTHGHLDHLAGVAHFQHTNGLTFRLHESDAFLLDGLSVAAAAFGLPPVEKPTDTKWLHDGDELTVGEETIRVVAAPGHSPGGVILDLGNEMITGDVIFQASIGRTDLPGGDYETLIESIRSQVLSKDDAVILHPGHGPSTTVGRERLSNPFLQG